ncbi:helix-turn-helix domain-containing protein [Flavilitoribacter nigricans]|uniref:AraC family transcriptional regulator n=1 Tax=Flavilitoribacter nigricans (strain ATCC 23147 / DSM 23189 / NBRC 102662 / NCIMB 1420 / SS-2) TaxID=1122177 RepID=A0A2D0NEU1_FLAN2|nr:AraC family transcriptional regulator [Flavilitoribacter nigricans]PHN06890.1 AraC family transcriptional regulator [Flavilitoribacter nigricans DSM 23189 = NBRC 102662]
MPFFQFNQYSAPLLIGFVQGIVFAGLLWRRARRNDRLSDRLMAGLLLLCSAHIAQYMLGFGGWYDAHDTRSTFMFYFPFHNYLLLGPTLYFYFLSLTNHSFRFHRKDILHFIPGLLWVGLFTAGFLYDVVFRHWIMGEVLPDFFQTRGVIGVFMQGTIRDIFNVLGFISFYAYLIFTVRLYRRYQEYIIDHFSDTEPIRHNWLRNVLYTLISGLTVLWIFQVLSVFVDFSYVQFWNSHLVVAIMIYVVAVSAYISTGQILPQLAFEPDSTTPPAPEPETTAELSHWTSKLEAWMATEKPYLNPNLTLSELARQLQTNTSVLSRVINQGFQQNFNDFINSYRVEAVKERLERGDHLQLTLLSIALDCGFNSKATFNRAFKKFTGKSPREMT